MIPAIVISCLISLWWIYEIDREREREAERLEQSQRREFMRQRIEQADIDVRRVQLRSAEMQDDYDQWVREGRPSRIKR